METGSTHRVSSSQQKMNKGLDYSFNIINPINCFQIADIRKNCKRVISKCKDCKHKIEAYQNILELCNAKENGIVYNEKEEMSLIKTCQ